MPAPKGNRNALKHGLFAGRRKQVEVVDEGQLRNAAFAIAHLQGVIEVIAARLEKAEGDEFARPANCLALASTAFFNGHRTLAYLSGGATPMDEALQELKKLKFSED